MDALGPIGEAAGPAPPPDPILEELTGTLQERLRGLFQRDFDYQLIDNPEFGCQAGFHERDGELQDLSPYAFEARVEHNQEALKKLDAIVEEAKSSPADAEGSLTATDNLYAELFRSAIEGENRALELGAHLMPVNSIGVGGVHENFLELLEWMNFDTEEDYNKYLQRLMAFPKQAQGWCDLLAYGSGMRGIKASQSMLRRVPDRLRELLTPEGLSELRAPIDRAVSQGMDAELVERMQQGIENCFKFGIDRMLDFMVEFYSMTSRADPGCTAVRGGEALYSECLRFHTTTDKTAEEIHNLGLSEVARIEERLQEEVLDALNFNGTFVEFAQNLKADPKWFYESEDELLDGYRVLVDKIQAGLPKYFKKLPKMPLEVVRKTSGLAAYYFAGTVDGRPGRFYVNVSRLNERPKYEMPVLALHEGVPGHHLQGALALENPELPPFLRYIEDRRYEFCPARRPLYSAYLEGWALYCERLGEEMGMYETPHELFGRLSMEMMRAVRLVVDTGIHAYGWSVERAAKYMEEKTGMATAECESECHRYAAWPGQACAYKVGQIAIEEQRARAEERLGDNFSLPDFHDVLLSTGPLPLDVFSRQVNAWISERSST